MGLGATQRNISAVAIGQRPGFLSKGIKQRAINASNDGVRVSAVHSFLMTSAISVHKSVGLLPNCYHQDSFPPSASSPDGPAPTLVLSTAPFTKSASIMSNFVRCTCSSISVSKTCSSASVPHECFCFN